MSEPRPADLVRPDDAPPVESEPESKGPNLVLYFSLIAFALAAAIACAIMIVLPFYKSRH
jgi:hypothetical protein